MQMSQWGENAFINYLQQQFPAPNDVIGIGDDCAQIPLNNDFVQLVTTDALVEGIHFLKEQIPPKDLGYKTIAVNVSDIAAMGGIPEFAFLAIAIPSETESSWLKELVTGIKEACQQFGVALLGGDTVGSKRDLFISITLTGKAKKNAVKNRHTAKVGDYICICGQIGSSGAGFRALQQGLSKSKEVKELISAHFRPKVYPKAGTWLAKNEAVHAMMDLSDGLDIDLRRILTASNCGAEIEIEKLPTSLALREVCIEQDWDVTQLALTGGEDYALLLTVSEQQFANISTQFEKHFHDLLHQIGKITASPNQLIYTKQHKPIDFQPIPFDHFSK
jgi:thiamine-monophosphate kinase